MVGTSATVACLVRRFSSVRRNVGTVRTMMGFRGILFLQSIGEGDTGYYNSEQSDNIKTAPREPSAACGGSGRAQLPPRLWGRSQTALGAHEFIIRAVVQRFERVVAHFA
jgi:hypothetical protein